ncbi:MAG: hypothetical protein HYT78_17555 [Deltaproteobacteria bacterium]|nr:hypothetical protein [Deltaproteobacteria bacterium]
MYLLFLVVSAVVLLFPDWAWACPRHIIHVDGLVSKPAGEILFSMAMMTIISVPLGLVGGRWIRRLSPIKKTMLVALVIAGAVAFSRSEAYACHGAEVVGPLLKTVHAAQLEYYRAHGVYAASFDELGMKPASDQYSYFLPSQVLPAKNPLPKEGVDLGRLPQGVAPVASAEEYTVVAIAFAAPDRIDVWTMDQNEKFREWSVAAFPKTTPKADVDNPTGWREALSRFLNELEAPLLIFSVLLGLSLGFAYSLRATPGMMPARS